MKKIKFLLLINCFINLAIAQSGMSGFTGATILQVNSSNYYPITMVDRQGATIKRGIIDQAVGSPYFNEEWIKAKITTTNEKVFDSVEIKIHLQSNEIHFKKDAKTIVVVDTGIIKQIEFYKPDSTVFESRFPSINKNNQNTFYKVLAKGKYTLLCQLERIYVQSKNEYSGEQTNEFKSYTNYFTVINNQIKQFNIKKDIKKIETIIEKEDNNKFQKIIQIQKIESINNVMELFKKLNN